MMLLMLILELYYVLCTPGIRQTLILLLVSLHQAAHRVHFLADIYSNALEGA